jgi:hypothetical protein
MKELKNLQSSNNKKLLVVLPVNKVLEKNLNQAVYGLREQSYPTDVLFLTNSLSTEDEAKLNSIIAESIIEMPSQKEDGSFEMVQVKSSKNFSYVVEKTDSETFPKLFNESFNYALHNEYSWFSVVEYLDIISKNWYKTFDMFSESKPNYDVFTPITKQSNNGLFGGFLNEACWAEGVAEEAGIFDLNMLLRMNCINVTGTVYKAESLKQYSEERDGLYYPMKENLKVSCCYEFFLRFIYNDLKIFSIPRIGYEYSVVANAAKYDEFLSKVPTNLLNISKEEGGLTNEEYQFWLQAAKKEYFFDEQRNVEYKEKA